MTISHLPRHPRRARWPNTVETISTTWERTSADSSQQKKKTNASIWYNLSGRYRDNTPRCSKCAGASISMVTGHFVTQAPKSILRHCQSTQIHHTNIESQGVAEHLTLENRLINDSGKKKRKEKEKITKIDIHSVLVQPSNVPEWRPVPQVQTPKASPRWKKSMSNAYPVLYPKLHTKMSKRGKLLLGSRTNLK